MYGIFSYISLIFMVNVWFVSTIKNTHIIHVWYIYLAMYQENQRNPMGSYGSYGIDSPIYYCSS